MDSGTPLLDAWFDSARFRDKFGDMSADEIEQMSFAEYAARTGREFKVTPVAEAEPVPAGQDPAGVMAAQHPQHATEDPGVDFQRMTMRQYEQIPSRYIRPSSTARGILGN